MSDRAVIATVALALAATVGTALYLNRDLALVPGTAPRALASTSASPGTHGDGYSREAFLPGSGWGDLDADGCDTRNEVLARYVTDTVLASNRCTVTAGMLVDPYTSAEVSLPNRRVQMDHVVSLHTAWHTGASQWSPERREAFANDPSNLLPTTLNSSKGDRGPAQLLTATGNPADKWHPSPAGECTYAQRYVLAAAEWRLRVESNDADALATMLERCPS